MNEDFEEAREIFGRVDLESAVKMGKEAVRFLACLSEAIDECCSSKTVQKILGRFDDLRGRK